MKFEHLQGSIVAMVTPFCQDGSVNFDMLTELLERQIAAGTDGILTLGTTGEYSTMSHEEDAAVVEHTIRVVDGRVPVMVGSGSNCTVTQIEKSRLYQSMGADALLLISPTTTRLTRRMYRHFAETADAVDIPASSIMCRAVQAAPSRFPWWNGWPGTPTSPASKKPAAICPTP